MRGRDGRSKPGGWAERAPELVKTPGKVTLTEGLSVQARTSSSMPPAEVVQEAAGRGIATPTTAMPHASRIQAAFGPEHDISAVQAHIGGGAAAACADMGASAFASGSHVVFSAPPDLHTAAHEA